MSLEFTLHSIARSIFTDELLDSFLAEDQKTVDQRDPFLQDQVYQEKKAALVEALTPAQAAKLTAMEALHRDALRVLTVLGPKEVSQDKLLPLLRETEELS